MKQVGNETVTSMYELEGDTQEGRNGSSHTVSY